MEMALELAQLGRGAVEPNPMVAAVVVRDGEELGRGWHRKFGGPHAEIEALAACRKSGVDPRGATMFVTLEPCCHHGKTPPCTDAIIESGISRVVVAMEDPDRQVAGKGIEKLRSAGIEVSVGLCEKEAKNLLAAYIKLRMTGRPWVICKWAQTPKGYLALGPRDERWISGEASRQYVHAIRGLCDGILVGIGTVLADDPLLTNRSGHGKQPVRVVLDSKLRISHDCQLVKTAHDFPLIVATTRQSAVTMHETAAALLGASAELLVLDGDEEGLILEKLLDELGRKNWTSLLVEGGAKVLDRFVYSGLADELLVFVSPKRKISRKEAQKLPRFNISDVQKKLSLPQPQELTLGQDKLLRFTL